MISSSAGFVFAERWRGCALDGVRFPGDSRGEMGVTDDSRGEGDYQVASSEFAEEDWGWGRGDGRLGVRHP